MTSIALWRSFICVRSPHVYIVYRSQTSSSTTASSDRFVVSTGRIDSSSATVSSGRIYQRRTTDGCRRPTRGATSGRVHNLVTPAAPRRLDSLRGGTRQRHANATAMTTIAEQKHCVRVVNCTASSWRTCVPSSTIPFHSTLQEDSPTAPHRPPSVSLRRRSCITRAPLHFPVRPYFTDAPPRWMPPQVLLLQPLLPPPPPPLLCLLLTSASPTSDNNNYGWSLRRAALVDGDRYSLHV
jgi:hypothetical protein